MLSLVEEAGLGDLMRKGKRWTVEEVEHDIIDAAVSVLEVLQTAEEGAKASIERATTAPVLNLEALAKGVPTGTSASGEAEQGPEA